jgi:hypothetical protein
VECTIELYQDLEHLRGPLDPFTRIASVPAESLSTNPKKKLPARDMAGVPIKAYQIEEILL